MPAAIISIASHKGGTGKTVTAMALSAALGRSGKKTLLIDLDPQGHSTLGFGITLGDRETTVSDLFLIPPSPIETIIRQTTCPNVDILPANIDLERMTQFLFARSKWEELLKRALLPVMDRYEFVIVDCASSFGAPAKIGIWMADLIVLPCKMEARAADAVVDLLESMAIVKGNDFTNWHILRTKIDSRRTLTNAAISSALERWTQHMFQTHIPYSESLDQAQIARVDIYAFDPKSKGALAYQSLAKEVLAHVVIEEV